MEKEVANNLKESLQGMKTYDDIRIVRNRKYYIDSEGCYTSQNNGLAVVNGGTSSYVLFDEDIKKFVYRKKGNLDLLKEIGLSILVGMVGGGMHPLKPTKTKIIAEVRGGDIIYRE